MKKNKNPKKSEYIYFQDAQETVYRTDETQKNAVLKKVKRQKAKRIAINVVSVFLVVTIILSSTVLGKRGIEKFLVLRNEKVQNSNATLSEDVKKELEDLSEEEKWAYLYEQYPEIIDVKFPTGIMCDYALYYAQNPQTVGYIKIDDTKIDYPVVQADNNKYYLNHDFYGKATSYGSIYANHKNEFQPFDRNTLLYGHNMRDGSRFAALTKYKNLDFFKSHPTIQFDTLYEKHTWKICAVIITNGSVDSNDGYFFDFTFNKCSDLCYIDYIEEIKKRSLYDTGVDIEPTDELLTLCTCVYDFDDARLLVIARKTRKDEDTHVDTTKAKYKSEPVKYPSAYYSNPNKNPYKNDKKFYLY